MRKIWEYLKARARFRVEPENDTLFYIISSTQQSKEIGFIWFKNALGGWRISFYDEHVEAWEPRGVIKTIEMLNEVIHKFENHKAEAK